MAVVRWKIFEPLLENFSFENEDEIESGLGEYWVKQGSPTLSLITTKTYVKHRAYSQKVEATFVGEGISQTIDISNLTETDFTFIFYSYIPTGELKVKIEALNSSDIVIGTLLEETYSLNTSLTKYIETFTTLLSGVTPAKLKVYFIQSGATSTTFYVDSVLLYETTDAEVSINPTTFGYTRIAKNEYQATLDGKEVKIRHLDEGRRFVLDNISPFWMFLNKTQKEHFEDIQGEDLVIITHEDYILWVDFESMDIRDIEDEEEDFHYVVTMVLKYVDR